ncbi:hypothetical protein ACIPSA_18385 [Streptomyces sp. NPDC086549]|uniref:hypothetical protein n=1 Tax=Streptomyces sp. NPDC086549 TaxID=3365752 RepID=UPI0037FE8ECB
MRRNPYLVLGVLFGAGREEANIAFVRRTRALRRGLAQGDPTDLTWALNRIDEAGGDPADRMDVFRVPALPEAFEGGGPGVFEPGPEPLAARPGDRRRALGELREQAAVDWVKHLVSLHASRTGPLVP